MRRFALTTTLVATTLAMTASADAATWTLQYARTPGKAAPARLLARLDALGLQARGFQALPMVAVSGTTAQLRRAAHAPGVIHARRADRPIHFMLDRSVPLIFHEQQQATWAQGTDGAGTTVAVVDTGIDGTHPDLIDHVTQNVEFVLSGSEIARAENPGLPPLVVAQPCPVACNTDQFGHGTHVAGIVAGSGALSSGKGRGVAPGTKLVGLAISNTGLAAEFYALAGFDYLLAHPELGVDVVNNSWGLNQKTFDPGDPVNQAAKMLHDRGITVVFAAGNSSWGSEPRKGQPEGSSDCTGGGVCRINTNSVAPWVISVAAGSKITPGGPGAQHLANFSSRGDPQPHVVGGVATVFQPDLTAPGSNILSTSNAASAIGTPGGCAAIGDPERCSVDRDPATLPFYTAMNGTSMASPHVAGAAAVLQSAAKAKLGRRLTPDEVRDLLVRGAAPMTGLDGDNDLCGGVTPLEDHACGEKIDGTTGAPYAPWQVGAGYLDVAASLALVDAMARPVAPSPPRSSSAPAAPKPGTAKTTHSKRAKKKKHKRRARTRKRHR